jgi:hypothetical protein
MFTVVVAATTELNAVCTSAELHEAALMVCARPTVQKREFKRNVNISHFMRLVIRVVPLF